MIKIESLCRADAPQAEYDNIWIPARPERFHSIPTLVHDLWEVFRGRAEAVTWPEQRVGPIDQNGMTQYDYGE